MAICLEHISFLCLSVNNLRTNFYDLSQENGTHLIIDVLMDTLKERL